MVPQLKLPAINEVDGRKASQAKTNIKELYDLTDQLDTYRDFTQPQNYEMVSPDQRPRSKLGDTMGTNPPPTSTSAMSAVKNPAISNLNIYSNRNLIETVDLKSDDQEDTDRQKIGSPPATANIGFMRRKDNWLEK